MAEFEVELKNFGGKGVELVKPTPQTLLVTVG